MNKHRLLLQRWIKFSLAGALGVILQLFALAALIRHMDFRLATALAVEIAVLHNFVWHEQMTWRDRTQRNGHAILNRLCRFHLANGVIAISGNVLSMWLLAAIFGLPLLIANLISIALCSFANFAASEWFVFAAPRVKYPKEQMFI